MKFVTPVLFLLAGIWVSWSNDAHADRVLTMPFMDVFTDDVHEQGRLTAYVCWGIAGVLFTSDLVSALRRKPRSPDLDG